MSRKKPPAKRPHADHPIGLAGAVCNLLMQIAPAAGVAVQAPAFNRWWKRAFCVVRYQQLVRSAGHTAKSVVRLAARIDREAESIDPTWGCATNNLLLWLEAWQRTGDDGRAAGVFGLLNPFASGVPRKKPDRGAYAYQSPEAVAYFNRLYIDRKGQTVAKVHRMTLAESERRGWAWPRTVAATRDWLNREGRKGRPKGI